MPTPTKVAHRPGQAARQPRCSAITELASRKLTLVRSPCGRRGFAGHLEGEFENFAARVPRSDPADHDELDRPLGELPDSQPGAPRDAQLVSGAARYCRLGYREERK